MSCETRELTSLSLLVPFVFVFSTPVLSTSEAATLPEPSPIR